MAYSFLLILSICGPFRELEEIHGLGIFIWVCIQPSLEVHCGCHLWQPGVWIQPNNLYFTAHLLCGKCDPFFFMKKYMAIK